MNPIIPNNNNNQTASGVVLGGVVVPGAVRVVPGVGAAGAGNGNVPIVAGVGVVAGSGSSDVAGHPGDASAPKGVHRHGLSSGGVPAVGGGDVAGSVVASEAGPVPPLAVVSNFPNNNPAVNFQNNDPGLVPAAAVGAPGGGVLVLPLFLHLHWLFLNLVMPILLPKDIMLFKFLILICVTPPEMRRGICLFYETLKLELSLEQSDLQLREHRHCKVRVRGIVYWVYLIPNTTSLLSVLFHICNKILFQRTKKKMMIRWRRRNMAFEISKFSVLEKALFWMTFTI